MIPFVCFGQKEELQARNVIGYTQAQGLSSYNIHKVIKDGYGFLWVATQDGLNRFEGKDFSIYNKDIKDKTLFSSDIRDLIYDSAHHMLWVICNQGGINGINIVDGTVQYSVKYPDGEHSEAWRICAVQRLNKIFIGTSAGLEVFNMQNRLFEKKYDLVPGDKTVDDIRSIDIDQSGNLWLGILNKGIFILDPDRHVILNGIGASLFFDKDSQNNFWPLGGAFCSGNVYWLGTKNGLHAVHFTAGYRKLSLDVQKEHDLFPGQEISDLTVKGNSLFLAAENLYEVSIPSMHIARVFPDKKDAALWLRSITHIYAGEDNDLWIGCRQGLMMVKNAAPFLFGRATDKTEGDIAGHIYSLCVINENKILAGTQQGLVEVDPRVGLRQLTQNELVQNIFRLTNDDILISGNKGVKLYSGNKIIDVSSKYPEFRKYVKWQFNSAVPFGDSAVIIGVESNQGVLLWNRFRHTILEYDQHSANPEHRLLSNTINTVYRHRNNELSVLSDYGITKLAENAAPVFVLEQGNSKGDEAGIFMDITETKTNYWVAAYGKGLLKLDKNYKPLKVFKVSDGLSNSGVYKLFNYRDSLLLITSNNGLSVFNPATEKFLNFFENDGLHNNVFEEACGDSFEGKFYAGGVNGFTIIDPSKLRLNDKAPQVYIRNLQVETDDGQVEYYSQLNPGLARIPSNVLQTIIYFTAINWKNPSRVNFAWRIKENSSEWSFLGSRNFINPIGFAPGTYHIEVKAANEDGVWSEPKELVLRFLPKWYQTWWFRGLILLLIALIFYALYRYRISQIKKQHEIRKNIATDLHDDLGSTLNSVKVFTNLAISGVNQDESLQQVKNNLNEATMGLRDMIWVLDDSMDTVDELVTRLKQFALPLTAASRIDFEIKAGSEVNAIHLTKEEKRNLFLICKEAINNSVKYSEATKIDIRIEPAGKKIKILVADNGKGFNTETVKRGYGLKNMQYRATQVKYQVRLETAELKGVKLQILPA
ncbi:MAG: triple tyrosine motif-containing protein [Ferruginibacter sp.]